MTGYLAFFWCFFMATLLCEGAHIRLPSKSECENYAAAGECVRSDEFMREHCRNACDKQFRRQRLAKFQRPIASSFFDLKAKDIDGKEIDFSVFRGKVTVMVNVASECGYTEEHYEQMVELYDSLSSSGNFEIVAFPCNQFDGQEPGDRAEIKSFTKGMGVQFRVMDKIDVNGPYTHDVYRFLKGVAGPSEIEWNFETYYVISPDGHVRSYSDFTPLELRDEVTSLLNVE